MLIYSILLLLLSNAVLVGRDKSILFSRVSMIVLIYTAIIAQNSVYGNYLDVAVGLYGGLFHVTCTTQIFSIFILLITIVILQLTSFYPRKPWMVIKNKYGWLKPAIIKVAEANKVVDANSVKLLGANLAQYKTTEYPLIILFIVTGSIFLISTSDLISIFLSIELQSYGLYLLSTIYRNSEFATSAGLTYFLLGGLSSCFILLGTSFLYSNSGLTNLDGLYVITSLNDVMNNQALFLYSNYYINMSLLIFSVGFLFKVSAAPFHFWSPDVYDAIPTVVTTFVAIVAKIAIFVFLLELVHYTSNSLYKSEFTWTNSLLISCLLSLIIGTIVGLTQFRIKKLFAYSTISHMGFILLALTVNSIESIQAFVFYLIQYSLSNLLAFLLLISIGYTLFCYTSDDIRYENLKDKENSAIQTINQLKGFFYINPFLSISFALTIFSFVGIPPLMGFFGKQMVLSAALDNGYVFITLTAILTSVIGAVYYLNLIKQMFFLNPDYKLTGLFNIPIKYIGISNNRDPMITFSFKHCNLFLSSCLSITVSAITLIIALFIFSPEELLSIANILALTLFNP